MSHVEYTFKVGLFADKEVGKRKLTIYIDPIFDEKPKNAIGVDFLYKKIETFGIRSAFSFWICTDEERFRSLFPNYFMGSHGIILMYNITKASSLNYLSEVLQNVKKVREKCNPPILLVGNKSDLKKNRGVSNEQIKKFKIRNNISKSMEISIKTGENVEKMFMRITRMALKNTSLRQVIPFRREESILSGIKFVESLDYKTHIPIACWVILVWIFIIGVLTVIIQIILIN